MAGLTVAEKEHWKDRIGRKVDRRIEALTAASPGLMERIRREAKVRAIRSLGLAELQAELDALAGEKAALERRERQARRAMVARIRGVAAEDVEEATYGSRETQEVQAAVARRQAVHEEQLLAEDEVGRRVLALRAEKENLLDTVWIASSPAQIKQLWAKVNELLGDEPTELERAALIVAPTKED